MKLNCECVRDVLLELEYLLTCEENNGCFNFNTVSISKLIENLSDKYESTDIFYTVFMLNEGKYIEAKFVNANSMVVRCEIISITHEGHIFLDSLRPKKVWEQLKEIMPFAASAATIANTALNLSSSFMGLI